ncbi:hypothetical protein KKA94_02510 [Patescibacteria group bacterium]|nr:hypothetical protein [Patescibacteria group bacterium]
MKIIPSILVKTKDEFINQVNSVSSEVDQIQLDIADGNFVKTKTWADPKVVKDSGNINIELHLMVEHPLQEIKKWTHVPQITRILFHFESSDNIENVIESIHANNWEASIVLNPGTKLSKIEPYLDSLEGLMFMGVEPGSQGQKFIPETIDRIKEFKMKQSVHFVELDGGVNEGTLPEIISSGVDAVCPGSAIFGGDKKPEENIEKMREIISSASQPDK